MKGVDRFVALRNSIRTQLFTDSENAIQNTISSLAWNDSIYRTFNEGLRLAAGRSARAKIPKSLVEYIHRAHVAYVVIALRKLYDDKLSGAKAVNSLRSITQQIVDNSHLFKREVFVTYDGLPYEEAGAKDRKTGLTVNWRHHHFDLLCRRASNAPRRPTDKLDVNVPIAIHQRAVLRPEIEVFANKFLVHSAARNNRPNENYVFKNVTLARIQLQYKNAIWASQQIGRFLCEPILSEVPTPQFDVLEQWENGLFSEPVKRKLLAYWYRRMDWWEKWTRYYWDYKRLFLHT